MWYAPKTLNDIANKIRNDQVGLMPFDTVWGLVGQHSAAASDKLFAAKKRPPALPLLTVIGSIKWLETLTTNIPDPIRNWIPTVWPGPVTLILPKHPNVPDFVTAGSDKIAIRFPDYFLTNQLLDIMDAPLFSTSANIHQDDTPKTRSDIPDTLIDELDFVFDRIPPLDTQVSTIIDCTVSPIKIIRKGRSIPATLPQ